MAKAPIVKAEKKTASMALNVLEIMPARIARRKDSPTTRRPLGFDQKLYPTIIIMAAKNTESEKDIRFNGSLD